MGQIVFPDDPHAKTLAELVTPGQLIKIRTLARNAGVNPDDECQSVMHANIEELSKTAGASLIEHLQTLQNAQVKKR